MRLVNLACTLLLVLGFANTNLFSQFKVNPKVELNISLEDGCQEFPRKITFVGYSKYEKNKVYILKTSSGQTHYVIYDVEPGKYFVSFSIEKNNEAKGVFLQYDIRSFYDQNKGEFGCDTFIPNEIEIKPNRNLKLDLIFKQDSSSSGFYKEIERALNAFDYNRLIYYYKISNDIPDISAVKTNSLNKLERNSPFSSESLAGSGSKALASSDIADICGQSGGTNEIPIGSTCIKDEGNIEIKINKAKFKTFETQTVNSPEPDSTQDVSKRVGTQDRGGKWICGITTVTIAEPICSENSNPQDCDAIKATYSCDNGKKKCKFTFEYDIKFEMEIQVWNPDEMCTKIQNLFFDNKDYDLTTPSTRFNKNCCWYHEAVKYHEALHCTQWTEASDKLKGDLCNALSDYEPSAKECCEDDDCKSQSESLKMEIYGKIFEYLYDIFQKPGAGDYQEDRCYREEERYFLKNVGRPCRF